MNSEPRTTKFEDLGLIDYKKAWDYQLELFNQILNIKQQNFNLPDNEQLKTNNYLLFCEHPNVYTLGKSGSEANLLMKVDRPQTTDHSGQWTVDNGLRKINADYYRIERGGDITYHGPGQIVGYPILDLQNFGLGIKEYIWNLEESIILTLAEYNIKSERLEGATGVWINNSKFKIQNSKLRKICAIGVRTSRFTTMHGFALNVDTDLSYFSYINPCGFTDKSVTSMQKELVDSSSLIVDRTTNNEQRITKIDIEEVKLRLKNNIQKVFKMKFEV